MKPRAIICDVYRTILDVGPPVGDAEERWLELFRAFFGHQPGLAWAAFRAACLERIEEWHEHARRRGISFPEVQWPCIVGEVLPAFDRLRPEQQATFLVAEQSLERRVTLAAGAADALRSWVVQGLVIGIASNAQHYTQLELAQALAPAGLTPEIFAPDLAIWSWKLGFSKPDPYFFRVLAARLASRGIAPGEALMVGDRTDNDIAPALAAGFATWHLHPKGDGGWNRLRTSVRDGQSAPTQRTP